jgi:hypothetical protein
VKQYVPIALSDSFKRSMVIDASFFFGSR